MLPVHIYSKKKTSCVNFWLNKSNKPKQVTASGTAIHLFKFPLTHRFTPIQQRTRVRKRSWPRDCIVFKPERSERIESSFSFSCTVRLKWWAKRSGFCKLALAKSRQHYSTQEARAGAHNLSADHACTMVRRRLQNFALALSDIMHS